MCDSPIIPSFYRPLNKRIAFYTLSLALLSIFCLYSFFFIEEDSRKELYRHILPMSLDERVVEDKLRWENI